MRMWKRIAILCLVVLGIGTAAADTRITYVVHKYVPGANSEGMKELWVGPGRLAVNEDGRSIVILLDRREMLLIDHTTKSFHRAKLADVQQMASSMVGSMAMEAAVSRTDETKDIAGFSARKMLVEITGPEGPVMQMTLWTTDEIGIDLAEYKRMVQDMASLWPMGAEVFREIAAIEGFPVLQEQRASMLGQAIVNREEVVSVRDEEPPAGTYDAPEGFTEEPLNPMSMMEAGG